MFNYSQDGITISSMQDIRKANKDKKFPIKIRVTFRRERQYYSTGKSMSTQEWESLPGTKSKAASELKNAIQVSFDTVKKVSKDLINEGNFSFELLNIRLGRALTNTINAAFKAKIELLKIEERVGTVTTNKNALSSIEKFGGNNIQFSSISIDWLKKYERWMLSDKKSYTTIGMYLRAVRAIVNDAKDAGIIKESQYPFGEKKYQIPTGEGRKLALTTDLIKKVVDYTDHHEVTPRYRDLWFLSYLMNGINMNDLLRLKDSNIRNQEIRFLRGKSIRTKKEKKDIVIDLNPTIQELLDKWGVRGRRDNDYIFPYLQGIETAPEQKKMVNDVTKRINQTLKRIGKALGIDDFTTYSARHSFATVLLHGGAPHAAIQEALGHEDTKTTENYLSAFKKDLRQKNASMLTSFLKDEEKEIKENSQGEEE